MPSRKDTRSKQVGRPKVIQEQWAKVNMILLNRNIVFLDRLAADIREQTAKPVTRAEVIRKLIEFAESDPKLKSQLINSFVPTRE